MTPVVAVWAIAPCLLAAHVARCVLAGRRDRRRELREYRADRAALRLVESSNVVDLALYVSSRGPERAA